MLRLINVVAASVLFLTSVGAEQVVLKHQHTVSTTEGDIAFDVPGAGKPCFTHYTLFGELTPGVVPLVTLHGGPGATSSLMTAFADITAQYGVPVLIYDQLGNGLSTHLPERFNDTDFWTEDLFLSELDNVLETLGIADAYMLLGHSWGGMLGSRHATRQPPGLQKLVIASSPASMPLWGAAQDKLRAALPKDVRDALDKGEREGTTDSEEYQAAVQVFYSRHLCRMDPLPASVVQAFEWLEKDPTVYMTMNGPNEFYVIGSLKNWTVEADIHKINVPTFVTNGRYDEAQDNVIVPFLHNIKDVRWIKFEESSHMAHEEQRERYMELLGKFLTE